MMANSHQTTKAGRAVGQERALLRDETILNGGFERVELSESFCQHIMLFEAL
jgi:hypothetical protein